MKLALIGFGTVGQGFVQILRDQASRLTMNYGFNPSLVAVVTLSRGALYHPNGLNLAQLLQAMETGSLDAYPDQPGLIRNLTAEQAIAQTTANVVIEASFTNLENGYPAIDYCRLALNNRKHVVTANKGPVALAFKELRSLARQNTVFFQYEATVMSGTPVIQLGVQALAGTPIRGVRGILNGTTNYILTQMEQGKTYDQALLEAQQLGYAESNPSADVDGWDTLSKIIALANSVMGGDLTVQQIPVRGITGITSQQVTEAWQAGYRWKLVGSIWYENDQLRARVEPERLPITDPLATVSGITNALTYTTELLGDVTLVGPGAGAIPTGFGILSDLLEIFRKWKEIE